MLKEFLLDVPCNSIFCRERKKKQLPPFNTPQLKLNRNSVRCCSSPGSRVKYANAHISHTHLTHSSFFFSHFSV